MKPYKTLRNLLVHPKDKHTVGQTGECVYKILCHDCSSTYIGETGRSYGKRQEEHRKEVESISNRTLTWADWKDLVAETNKSAITDDVAKENHVINWYCAKILNRESFWLCYMNIVNETDRCLTGKFDAYRPLTLYRQQPDLKI